MQQTHKNGLHVCLCVCVFTLVVFVQQSALTVKPGRPFVNHALLGIGVFNCGVIVSDKVRLQTREREETVSMSGLCNYVRLRHKLCPNYVLTAYSIHNALIFAVTIQETNTLCFMLTGNEAICAPRKANQTATVTFCCCWDFLFSEAFLELFCSSEQLFHFLCALHGSRIVSITTAAPSKIILVLLLNVL